MRNLLKLKLALYCAFANKKKIMIKKKKRIQRKETQAVKIMIPFTRPRAQAATPSHTMAQPNPSVPFQAYTSYSAASPA
jgi:hypothetical protein